MTLSLCTLVRRATANVFRLPCSIRVRLFVFGESSMMKALDYFPKPISTNMSKTAPGVRECIQRVYLSDFSFPANERNANIVEYDRCVFLIKCPSFEVNVGKGLYRAIGGRNSKAKSSAVVVYR